MATYLEINSASRDRIVYPNPSEFVLPAEATQSWLRSARSVRAFPSNPLANIQEFVTSVELKQMVTPYDSTFATITRLYVDFHSQTYNDRFLVQFPFGVNRDAKFVMCQDKIQNDGGGTAVFIVWKNVHHEQVMRFRRDEPVTLRVFTVDGVTLPITDAVPPLPADPRRQITFSFSTMPYIRDPDIDNHLVGTTTG